MSTEKVRRVKKSDHDYYDLGVFRDDPNGTHALVEWGLWEKAIRSMKVTVINVDGLRDSTFTQLNIEEMGRILTEIGGEDE